MTMQHPRPQLTHPQRFIAGLEKSPQYLSELRQRGRKKALGNTARFFAAKMEAKPERSAEDRLNEFAVRLIGALPDFIDGQRQLDRIEFQQETSGYSVDRDQKLPHLKKVIPFNHVVRELIDQFQGVTADNIIKFSGFAGDNIENQQTGDYVEQKVRQVVAGMQHEIGLEQVLWAIEDVEDVRQADEYEELEGKDLIVTYRGEDIALDAKASQKTADRAYDKRAMYMQQHRLTEATMGNSGYPLWSGLDYREFQGGFRVNDAAVKRCAPYIEQTLSHLYAARHNSQSIAR